MAYGRTTLAQNVPSASRVCVYSKAEEGEEGGRTEGRDVNSGCDEGQTPDVFPI